MPLLSTRGANAAKGFGLTGGAGRRPYNVNYLVIAGGGGGGLTAYQAATLSRGMRSDATEELGNLYERAATLAPGGVPLPAAVPQYEATMQRIASLENDLYGGASADTGAGLYSQDDLTQ